MKSWALMISALLASSAIAIWPPDACASDQSNASWNSSWELEGASWPFEPGSPEALAKRGDVLVAAGGRTDFLDYFVPAEAKSKQNSKAGEHAERSLNSGDAYISSFVGAERLDLRGYQDSALSWNAAATLNLASAWKEKASDIDYLGRYEEAIGCYDRALRADDRDETAWQNKGRAFNALGMYDQAIKCYERAIDLNPENARAKNEKGFALNQLGAYEEALTCFEAAIDIDKRYKEAWNNKGLALYRTSKYALAVEAYDEAIEIDQGYADAWYNKGQALRVQGDDAGANAAFARADELEQA